MSRFNSPEAQFITVDGGRYCYRRSGEGRAILLLHGLTDSGRFLWREFIRHFENEYTVIAVDLRGHGDSEKPKRGYAPADQAWLVAAFIDRLGLDRPVLLGHSLGGIIAAKFAILFPDRLSKLIISDSPLGAGFWKNLGLVTRIPRRGVAIVGLTMVPFLGRLVFKLRSPRTMRMTLERLQVFCDPSHITAELIQEKMLSTYEAISQSLWQAVIFENLFRDLDRISVPTLIIHGSHDTLVPLNWAERAVFKIQDSRLVLIENAGHFPLIEQPDQFNQAVSQFLSASE